MRALKVLAPLIAIALALTAAASSLALASEGFYKEEGEVFDDWGVARTRGYGRDGFFQVVSEREFRPVIVFESLGENASRAYRLGEAAREKFPDLNQRAEAIFSFVKGRVEYASDSDQFGFKEFAQNADEVALAVEEGGLARGDCEDYAALLAVMFKGAGLRSAIVLAPKHAATLVYLPGYKKANRVFEVGGERGWVWAEGTGRNNPLGWTPEEYIGERVLVYEVGEEEIVSKGRPPQATVVTPEKGGNIGFQISPFISVIGLMWIISLFRRRR